MEIAEAVKNDLSEILALQKLAYQSEARIYNDFCIPPLVQTLPELEAEAESTVLLKAVESGRIIGSVRAYEKDGACCIGRLIVHPERQNRGIGAKLLTAAEKCFEGMRYELFTGHLSEKNLAFYEKHGYKRYKTEMVTDGLQFIYLEK